MCLKQTLQENSIQKGDKSIPPPLLVPNGVKSICLWKSYRFLHLWNIFKEVNGGLDINQFPTNSNPDLEIEANSKGIHPKYYRHLKKVLTKAIWAEKKWAGFWKVSLYIKLNWNIKLNRNLDFNPESLNQFRKLFHSNRLEKWK